jgi:hypothetical protein
MHQWPIRSDDFIAALRELAKVQVLVGIPEEAGPPAPDRTINNATIGYIHEFGSTIRNIKPRPHLVPGVAGSQAKWEPKLQDAVKAALAGKPETMDKNLHAAGQIAVDAVKLVIRQKIPPPLKPATVAARKRTRKMSGPKRAAYEARYARFLARYAAGAATMAESGPTPLMDTGNYYRHIVEVVGKR